MYRPSHRDGRTHSEAWRSRIGAFLPETAASGCCRPQAGSRSSSVAVHGEGTQAPDGKSMPRPWLEAPQTAALGYNSLWASNRSTPFWRPRQGLGSTMKSPLLKLRARLHEKPLQSMRLGCEGGNFKKRFHPYPPSPPPTQDTPRHTKNKLKM